MRTINYCIISLIISYNVNAQSWSNVGGGTNDRVRALAVYNSVLFVGGDFISAGGVTCHGAATWDGTSWSAIPNPSNTIQVMIIYNNELYEGGSVGFSKWNGSSWVTVGTGAPGGHTYALAVHNNKLYATGSAEGICQWDGSVWSVIGNPSSDVYGLCSYKGELYATGAFTSINSVAASQIARWDGSTWSAVGNGILGGLVEPVATYNNELYVGGLFNTSAGNASNNITKWNGTTWLPVGTGASDRVFHIDSVDGNLYTSGYFTSISGVSASGIAYFDGSNWNPMGSGINSSSWADAITKFENLIYAGGTFTVAGDSICLNIAKWGLLTGISKIADINDVKIYPNPADYQLSILAPSQFNDERATILVMNSMGEKLIEKKVQSIQEYIDVTALNAGIYFMLIDTEKRKWKATFVKE